MQTHADVKRPPVLDIPDQRGVPQIVPLVGTLMDITEQEELTQQLREREAYLAEAQRLSHTGSFGWSVSTDEHCWSEETFRIFEYDVSAKIKLQSVLDRVH